MTSVYSFVFFCLLILQYGFAFFIPRLSSWFPSKYTSLEGSSTTIAYYRNIQARHYHTFSISYNYLLMPRSRGKFRRKSLENTSLLPVEHITSRENKTLIETELESLDLNKTYNDDTNKNKGLDNNSKHDENSCDGDDKTSLPQNMLYREGVTTTSKKFKFTHSSYEERLAASKPIINDFNRPPGGIKMLLLGKPCSGKGTQAPLIARKYDCVHISTGDVLREEVNAGTETGEQVKKIMEFGKLIPDDLIISLVHDRISKKDCQEKGWILDGFPRSANQVRFMADLKIYPDRVIVLERDDELIKEWCLNRYHDSVTGIIYHPKFNPPPPEVYGRLVWRMDDDLSTLETRLEVFEKKSKPAIHMYMEDNNLCGVDEDCENNIVHFIPTDRNELEVFSDIGLILNQALEDITGNKYGPTTHTELEQQQLQQDEKNLNLNDKPKNINIKRSKNSPTFQDIPIALPLNNYKIGPNSGGNTISSHDLLHAINRCNSYDMRSYIPVLIQDDVKHTTIVGYCSKDFASTLSILSPNSRSTLVRYISPSITINNMGTKISESKGGYLQLAPEATSFQERNRLIGMLTTELVKRGIIPKEKIRNELQNVYDIVHPDINEKPVAKLERAAMIYFGIPSYGVHINGYYKDPKIKNSRDPQKIKMWIGIRSMSKPTYPGLYDHIAAGGQPEGISFFENAKKECMEEAGIPIDILENHLIPTGMISYRYQTSKGLSTKLLNTFDLELPTDFVPVNTDGETSDFILLDLQTILKKIENELENWKPNVAITIIDFAIRHGFISPDDKNYAEMVHKLRGAYYDKQNIYI